MVSDCLKRKIKWAVRDPRCTAKSCCRQWAINRGSVMTWKTVSQNTKTSRILITSMRLIKKKMKNKKVRAPQRFFCFNALLSSELHLNTSPSGKGRNSRCRDYLWNWLSAYHLRFGSHVLNFQGQSVNYTIHKCIQLRVSLTRCCWLVLTSLVKQPCAFT